MNRLRMTWTAIPPDVVVPELLVSLSVRLWRIEETQAMTGGVGLEVFPMLMGRGRSLRVSIRRPKSTVELTQGIWDDDDAR